MGKPHSFGSLETGPDTWRHSRYNLQSTGYNADATVTSPVVVDRAVFHVATYDLEGGESTEPRELAAVDGLLVVGSEHGHVVAYG